MSALCLQLIDIQMILNEIITDKVKTKKAPKALFFNDNLGWRMVDAAGIEPATPTMST